MAYDAVIAGEGNLGLWTAYALRSFGRIAVCERSWAGGGATSHSAGVVRQQGGSEAAVKLGRLSRERDPNRMQDAIALPFPKK